MDCYDAKWCPEQECEICDFWIDQATGWKFVGKKIRQFLTRLWRRDFSAGYVYLGPPKAEAALRSIAKHCEFEAGRTRYNANPAALGSYWQGYDKAVLEAALVRQGWHGARPAPRTEEPAP